MPKFKEDLREWLECCLPLPQHTVELPLHRITYPGGNPGIYSYLASHENSLHSSEKMLRCFTVPDDTVYSVKSPTVRSVILQMEESADNPSVKSRFWSTQTLQQLCTSSNAKVQYYLHQLLSHIACLKSATFNIPRCWKGICG